MTFTFSALAWQSLGLLLCVAIPVVVIWAIYDAFKKEEGNGA